ncbi:capsular polysaccharide synthesis protein [Vibrio sp. TH_r3]|uniref:capsular polysaccharide synthesis protein n=1 Tax=Vibrio sp. TH_r3 TaxID=3082084 RepID=UPI0029548FA6|nr:capsular polysaccharide synthesis protein [Vibrio sp. TH_r3]MDV7104659.1 capsular polysaccharide synthesis protein [Vibrio sp. TH_r3]
MKGRLDKIRPIIFKNKTDPAVKCDVYRANLINQYGGIYCDASAIALNSLDSYFDIINRERKFIFSQRQSHGKSHYPVSFYGAVKHSDIISENFSAIDLLLKQKKI